MPELNDTSPEALQVQIQLLRKSTPTQRIARVRSLSGSVIRLSRRAIYRNKPHLSSQEIKLEFVSLHYGKMLAEKIKNQLLVMNKK